MAVRRLYRFESSMDVVNAAEERIYHLFQNGLPMYLSFSGGKDSLTLAQLVVRLIQKGKINPSQLTVIFIDEEAIYPCIEEIVVNWREKFLMLGVKFIWFCLEVKHFNCFNQLENDESFICWDSTKKEVWVRKPPLFAIKSHPLLKPRKHTYQQFSSINCKDGISLIGTRAAESIQRLNSIANMKGTINTNQQAFPIYDWTDKDVWLYLKEQQVEIPEAYLYMYQAGIRRNNLRISQFFSIDTARSLVKMNEYYPDLLERVIRREPNAYLAALYWDTEMFGRSSSARRELEDGEEKKNYKALLIDLFCHMDTYFPTKHKRAIAIRYKQLFLKAGSIMEEKELQKMYEGLLGGDPKQRTLRALYTCIYRKYADNGKKEREGHHV